MSYTILKKVFLNEILKNSLKKFFRKGKKFKRYVKEEKLYMLFDSQDGGIYHVKIYIYKCMTLQRCMHTILKVL